MKYTISIRPSAQKAISKIEKKIAQKIIERIDLLATDPRHHGSIKLSGEENAYEPIRKLFCTDFWVLLSLFCDFISRVIWAHMTLEMKSQKRPK